MTEVFHSPFSSSPPQFPPQETMLLCSIKPSHLWGTKEISGLTDSGIEEEEVHRVREKTEKERRDQLSLLALLVTLFRRVSGWLARRRECFSSATSSGSGAMEIGWPSDVQHVNHVTFDRFDRFLGLPVEFEPEVPRRAPSARYSLHRMRCAFSWVHE